MEQLRGALVEHKVLFFRGQDLADADQVAFASRLGKPTAGHPVAATAAAAVGAGTSSPRTCPAIARAGSASTISSPMRGPRSPSGSPGVSRTCIAI